MSRRKGKSLEERASERERLFTFIFYTLHINIDIIDFFHIPMENTTKMKTKWEKQKKNCVCNDKKVGRVARRWRWSKWKDTTKESGKKTRPHFMTQTYFTFKEKKKKKRKREWKKREKRRRARAKVQISNGENIWTDCECECECQWDLSKCIAHRHVCAYWILADVMSNDVTYTINCTRSRMYGIEFPYANIRQ